MSIQDRRNFLSKSSRSIDSIRKSVTSLGEGLTNASKASSQILQQTEKANRFRRTLEKKDGEFFSRRREAVQRRQREDELEASSVGGATKRQGTVLQKSTKGFLGRVLDFVGIVIIGWALTNLPIIIKKLEGLFKLINGLVGVLKGWIDTIINFLEGIRTAVDNFLAIFKRFDFGGNQKQIKEELERGNNSIVRLRDDVGEGLAAIANDPEIAKANEYSDTLDKEMENNENDEIEDFTPDVEDIGNQNIEGETDNNFQEVTEEQEVTETTEIEARAEGGPVESNKPFLVGEEGPELFVPPTGGEIVPNDELVASDVDDEEETATNFIEAAQGLIKELDIKSEPDAQLSAGGESIDGLKQADFDLTSERNQKTEEETQIEAIKKDQSSAINPIKKFFTNLRGRKKTKKTVIIVDKGNSGSPQVQPTSNGSGGTIIIDNGKSKEQTLLELQSVQLKQL